MLLAPFRQQQALWRGRVRSREGWVITEIWSELSPPCRGNFREDQLSEVTFSSYRAIVQAEFGCSGENQCENAQQ